MITPQDSITFYSSQSASEQNASFDIGELIHNVALLKDLLAKETELFRNLKIKEATKLFDEKNRLVSLLESQKSVISRNPDIAEVLTEEEKAALKKSDKELDIVMRANFHEVLKAKEINQRVVEAVSCVAARHERRASWYDATGASDNSVIGSLSRSLSAKTRNAPAITLSQTV